MGNPHIGEDDFSVDPLFSLRRRPTIVEINRIIGHVLEGNMTVTEMDSAIERMARARKLLLPRLLELMASPDPVQYQMSAILLQKTDLRQAVDPLHDLLQDPMIDDDHKMTILNTLQVLGGIARDEDPMTYLRDPAAVVERSHDTFLSMLQDPLEMDRLLNAILEGKTPALIRAETLTFLAASQDTRVLLLLLCLLHSPDDEMVVAAIEGLSLFQDPKVIQAFEERARFDPSSQVRQAAQNAARMLHNDNTESVPSIFELPLAPPPLVRCLISSIDGDGGQVVLITRQTPGNLPVFCDFMFNDHEGIKDTFGDQANSAEQIEALVSEGMAKLRVEMVEIGLDKARDEVEVAYSITLAANRRLPLSFMAWQPWLSGDDPTAVQLFSTPTLATNEQASLLERCSELLNLDEFATWMPKPQELGGLLPRFRKLQQNGAGYDAIQMLVSQGITMAFGNTRRQQLKSRLRRQAWFLAQIYEDEEIPKMALAASAGLEDERVQPMVDHPLLREMVLRSLISTIEKHAAVSGANPNSGRPHPPGVHHTSPPES